MELLKDNRISISCCLLIVSYYKHDMRRKQILLWGDVAMIFEREKEYIEKCIERKRREIRQKKIKETSSVCLMSKEK